MAVYLMKKEDIELGKTRVLLATPALLKRVGEDLIEITPERAAQLGVDVDKVDSPRVNKFRQAPKPIAAKEEVAPDEPVTKAKAVKGEKEAPKDSKAVESTEEVVNETDETDFIEEAAKKLEADKCNPENWNCDINKKKSLVSFAEQKGLKIDPWEVRTANCDTVIKMIQDYLKTNG